MSFGRAKEDKDQQATNSVPSSLPIAARPDTIIGKGTKIVGTLTFSGPVEVEGEVEGEVIAQDKLIVAESAKIKGKISGTEIVVRGEVRADVHASRKLTLRKPARVFGNISCEVLSIEEGVTFEGRCTMNLAANNQATASHQGASQAKSETAKPVTLKAV
jgi:cytoskeletal protein CcmA (bactofilin family)